MPSLFDPLTIGDLHLPNRIIMAPLTRLRADSEHVPTAIMADYYAQRASAGLIISEGVPVSRQGVGYQQVPGLWTETQTQAWKPVTQAVHDAGGRIFAQLWHVGRISHSSFNHNRTPVAPSAIAPEGHVSLLRPQVSYEQPRALSTQEISGIVESFRSSAVRALEAGFDGVELHGANGYLLDQFLQDSTNTRGDHYGGNIENRARLLLEVTDAVISVWGPHRVGVHLSPQGKSHQISDSNPLATFGYLAEQLGKRQIAFIFVREPQTPNSIISLLKQKFGGVVVANQDLNFTSAQQLLAQSQADAVAFGSLFIANPDLVQRFAEQAPLNAVKAEFNYSHGPEGYSDYPLLNQTG